MSKSSCSRSVLPRLNGIGSNCWHCLIQLFFKCNGFAIDESLNAFRTLESHPSRHILGPYSERTGVLSARQCFHNGIAHKLTAFAHNSIMEALSRRENSRALTVWSQNVAGWMGF